MLNLSGRIAVVTGGASGIGAACAEQLEREGAKVARWDVAKMAALPQKLALQGNLDPLALIAGGAALDAAVDATLEAFAPRAHVFNLGHGILPETPIAHVERMLARLR